jgi:CheY-like chemotaxis protein/anti-sigma regulatory factor (Ser/Thr protein kinase)
MTSILVVDDNPMDRRVACSLLEAEGWETLSAENGKAALERISRQQPDLVLSDLQMPIMDGLELVQQMVSLHPDVPVVVMTGNGSEALAVKALQQGALSYVPKDILSGNLISTLNDVLMVSRGQRRREAILRSITGFDTTFELGVQDTSVEALVSYLLEGLELVSFSDESDRIRVGTALHEALMNAREHGNLELDSDLREDDDATYRILAEERLSQSPYKDRKVYVRAAMSHREVCFEIRDEGPGFDTTKLPDPTALENICKVSGRGLFLIRTFMDEVTFNDSGNVITMRKMCDKA